MNILRKMTASLLAALLLSNMLFTLPAYAVQVTMVTNSSAAIQSQKASSPQTVFISDTEGYHFFVSDSGSCSYVVTTDGGDTWGSETQVDQSNPADCIGITVWYDQWTPGDTSGDIIHVATWESGGDDLYYTEFDTGSDTLTTRIADSGLGSAYNAGQNSAAITKATNGTLYVGIADNGASQTKRCLANCTAGNWSDAGTNPLGTGDYPIIMMPLSGGNVLLIRQYNGNIESKIFNGSAWSGSWTTIDNDAAVDTTYNFPFGATVNKDNNDIYLVYAADTSTLGTDDDIRTATFDGSWSGNSAVLTDYANGITSAKIGYDSTNDEIYVTYVRRNSGSADSANLYYQVSGDGMSSWNGESSALATSNGTYYGGGMNIHNAERLFASWAQDNGENESIYGNTIVDISLGGGGGGEGGGGGSAAPEFSTYVYLLLLAFTIFLIYHNSLEGKTK